MSSTLRRGLGLLVMLGWALCACAGDAGPQAEITCDEFCARHLDCKADPDIRCPTVCAIAQERCLELAEEYAACLLARPDSDFECNDADVTRPKAGVCEHEFDALAECAEGVLMMD